MLSAPQKSALLALALLPVNALADEPAVEAATEAAVATTTEAVADAEAEAVADAEAEAAPEAPAEEEPAAEDEEPVVKSKFALPVQFHGFAEIIARGDLSGQTFDFSVQQAEIDMIGDYKDVVFFRTDLQYDAYYFDATSPVGFLQSFVEQATVDIQFYEPAHLKIGAGRFNAPMGFEYLDPLDRPLASYSQVFNWMDPFLLTGVRLSGAYEWFDFVAWAAQGYEVIVDNNKGKTFGGRLGFTPVSAFNLGVAVSHGSEYADNANPRTGLAVDFTIKPSDKAMIGGEVNFRHEKEASKVDAGEDGMALGVLLEGSYRIHDYFGIAARADMIQDFDGIIWGQKLGTYTWTVGPTVHLFDHARIQLEYKGYAADEPFFGGDSPTPSAPNTSPTVSQVFQGMPLFSGTGTATTTSHALTLQMIGSF